MSHFSGRWYNEEKALSSFLHWIDSWKLAPVRRAKAQRKPGIAHRKMHVWTELLLSQVRSH
jgi:hypothetical protein